MHCTHNNGLHIWYLTGDIRNQLASNAPLVTSAGANCKPKNKNPETYLTYKQVCHNCGDEKWN